MAGRLGPRHSEKDNEAGQSAAEREQARKDRATVARNAKQNHSDRVQYGRKA